MHTVVSSGDTNGFITLPVQAEEAFRFIKPSGVNLMIRMRKQQEKSKGGLYIPEDSQSLLHTAQPVAQVVAIGEDAFHNQEFFPHGPRCKAGDWIIIQPYAGKNGYKFRGDDAEYRFIHDISVVAVIENGDAYAVERFI